MASKQQHLQANGDGSPISEASVSSSSSAMAMASALSKGKEGNVDGNGGGSGDSSKGAVARVSVGNGTSGPGDGASGLRQQVAAFEEESVEGLEKQEIAFRLFVHILDKVSVKAGNLEQVRTAAAKQLKSLPTFLKVNGLPLPPSISGCVCICMCISFSNLNFQFQNIT